MANDVDTKKESYELSYDVKQQVLERQEYICPICFSLIIGRCVFHHIRNRKDFKPGDPLRDDPFNLQARHEKCERYYHNVDRTGNPKFSRIWNGLPVTDEATSIKCQMRHPYGCLDPKRKNIVETRVQGRKGCYPNGFKDLKGISYSRKKILINQELVDAI